MTRTLGIVATIAVALTVALLLMAGLTTQRMSRLAAEPTPSYRVGDRIQPLPGFDYSEYEYSVLLPVSTACAACKETLALYRRIAAQLDEQREIRLVWISSDAEDVVASYLQAQGLPRRRILRVKPAAIRLRALPSVVVVNRRGIIDSIWTGRAAIDDQAKVIDGLARLNAKSS